MTGWPIAAVLAVYLYVFLEWLFFITKPSFLEALSVAERVRVLLVAPLPAVALLLAVWMPLWIVDRLLPGAARALRRGVVAAILACGAFILIDNFTYAVLGVGVVSTAGWMRFAYLALLLGLLAWLYRAVPAAPPRWSGVLTRGLVVVSLIGAVWQLAVSPSPPAVGPQGAARARELPHIVIVSGDGIDASHTSLYGHERRTTPFLVRLAQSALVFDNAFPNVNSSAGSVASLVTGKPPLRTNLLLHPDILTGVDAYQHLPGILRGLGYRTIHVSTRLYTDPFEQNMQHAFDVANFRERRGLLGLPELPGRLALAYMPALYFLGETGERLSERVLHAAGVRVMTNALTELQKAGWVSDDARIQAVLDFLDRADGPVFAHVHLMGTHIPLVPRRPVFSATGPCPPTEWELTMDTYDDVIADFDRDVQRIVEHLKRSGQFERTILAVTSDHGWLWSYARLPLMLRFPGGVPSGRTTENAQLIDVPPTLLDYLGVPIPEWMGGVSLLRPIDPLRPIFTVRIRKVLDGPFRRVRTLGLTVCERAFWLNPHVGGFFDDEVPGYVGPCAAGLPSREAAWTRLIDELRMNGYDVSSLSDRPPPAADLPKPTPTPAAGGGR